MEGNDTASFLQHDLEAVRGHLDSVFNVEGALMGEVSEYVRTSRGKLMRPRMVCLVARGLGYDGQGDLHTRLGAAVELFHVATLLHDDVIDNARLRRRRETVNAKYGADVAILFADYLYASCFDLALSALRPDVVRVLSRTTQKMAEGEMYQIEKRGQLIRVVDYLRIIQAKTAYLFSACAGLGAMVADRDAADAAKMFDFGLNYGMAFQITDDALDYDAHTEEWGKQVGADLQEGKQTLPLLRALEAATPKDRDVLVHQLRNGRDFTTVYGIVKHYNGIEYSLEKAGEYTKSALDALEGFGDNEAIAELRRLADGVLARQA